MKFRYKVLISNLILLSLSLGLVGYLMIHKNFRLAQDTQIQNAVVENNLVQSSVEYELLQILNNSGYQIKESLLEIGNRVASGLLSADSVFYIKYGDSYVYSGDGAETQIGDALFSELNVGGKNYMICEDGGTYYAYVSSCGRVDEKYLYVITKSDISDAYGLMNRQIRYFRFLIAAVLTAASIIMYFVSRYLTHPLEKLTDVTEEIAKGNYDTRVSLNTGDEIAQLADSFNRMAAAVSEHVDELNDMIRRRDQFVADFTHEVKTPMTAIIGYADTMRSMEFSREEQITYLNYIFSEGKRLEAMSQKLFDLIYLKWHDIAMTPVHTADLGKELERIVSPMLETKKIKLQMDVEPAVIFGSRELLVTAFVNLIDNAKKASEEGGLVRLLGSVVKGEDSSLEAGGFYELSVIDDGIGMTKEDAKKIYDEFYMVDKSRARREGGAGIGMSLVALILERHGAKLSIESAPEQGTRMRVTFVMEQNQKEAGSGYDTGES